MYDSARDTQEHITQVQRRLHWFGAQLAQRGRDHDRSKLGPDEKPLFDEMTPLLKGLTYGSEEYKAALTRLGAALRHHYAVNSHHPEHYDSGVDGMDLLDLVEMYVDWQAATLRHADGNFAKSIDHNETRFKMSAQLAQIFRNTFIRFGDVGKLPESKR